MQNCRITCIVRYQKDYSIHLPDPASVRRKFTSRAYMQQECVILGQIQCSTRTRLHVQISKPHFGQIVKIQPWGWKRSNLQFVLFGCDTNLSVLINVFTLEMNCPQALPCLNVKFCCCRSFVHCILSRRVVRVAHPFSALLVLWNLCAATVEPTESKVLDSSFWMRRITVFVLALALSREIKVESIHWT